MQNSKPHIVLIVARGEAVRNFVYSDTLPMLKQSARVTLLSAVDHGEVINYAAPYVDRVIVLKDYKEIRIVTGFRYVLHTAHFRWLRSENARHMWALHRSRAKTVVQKIKRFFLEFSSQFFANKPALRLFTAVENWLSWTLRPTRELEQIFNELQPDLVFNCSHIHGPMADLPMRVAHRMGLKTAVFVFSWDNLTTRSRIFIPYDHYLMWNEGMKSLLLEQYDHIKAEQVIVTGTPQFDFHYKPEYCLPREALCEKMGLDPGRPFILYTTGMDTDFLDEHKIVQEVIRILKDADLPVKPQLVVRMYIKGNSPEMVSLSKQKISDVVFPPILWDKQWVMPLREDLAVYSSLLHHCCMGINPASTVTLELMALDKPVVNLGMEPPGSALPDWERFSRHVEYEHYKPVAASGGVMVARSAHDLRCMIQKGLEQPEFGQAERKAFIHAMMGGKMDGQAGKRVAEALLQLARTK